MARGDCFSLNGLGGNDRITLLDHGYLTLEAIYGGASDDRVCVRNGFKERVDGGPGNNKVLADRSDEVAKAREVNHLNCS